MVKQRWSGSRSTLSNSREKIGILGGTFDPVHLGHLIIAEEVRSNVGLDKILFVPAGVPWMRENEGVSAGKHRLNMVDLAVKSNPHFESSSIEIDRQGVTYTADTLETLREDLDHEVELSFIMGMDVLEKFHLWKSPETVVELCSLVIVNRPGNQAVDVNEVVKKYPEAGAKLRIINVPRMEISSSEIRERVRQKKSLKYLVSEEVIEYIDKNNLYKG